MQKMMTTMAALALTVGLLAGNGICDGTGSGSAGNANSGGQVGSDNGYTNGGSLYGNGSDGTSGNGFDVENLVTVTGDIVGFYDPNETGLNTYHPILLVDGEEITVNTAPRWYLDQQGITFELGQMLTVYGSLGTNALGDSVLIAIEVTMGDTVLVLRDELGYPVWQALRSSEHGSQSRNAYLNIVYDIASEIQVDGTVLTVTIGSPTGEHYPGYQLTLDTGENVYNVMLAPFWFLTQQDIPLDTGLTATVTGMPASIDPGDGVVIDVLVARILEWTTVDGTFQLVLRDEDGLPLWQPLRGGRNN